MIADFDVVEPSNLNRQQYYVDQIGRPKVEAMEENLREMTTLGLDVPVLLGGAALTRHYCEGTLRNVYGGDVFYGRDAFEGLSTMDRIVSGPEGLFFVEAGYPHRIVRWEWKQGEADDSGELTGSERLEYWKLHGEGDERYLGRLGLKPGVLAPGAR